MAIANPAIDFDGKTVLVIGGTAGIGEATALRFAAGVPMRRISALSETAQAILWLCSDAASFITGHTLAVDGGMTVP